MNKREFKLLNVGDKVRNKVTGDIYVLKDKSTYSERLGDFFLGVCLKTTRVFPDDVWEKCE